MNAQVEQARQAHEKAKRDMERGERLYADKVISLEQLQDLRTQAAMAEAALNSAEFNWNYAAIVAPHDGTVLRRLAEERELVSAGTPVLVLGAQDQGFIVRTGLADREIVQVRLGDAAQIRLDALPDATLRGKVTEVASAADAASGMFGIEVTLDTTDLPLKSGLVAKLTIVPSSASARLARLRADRRDRRRRRPHRARCSCSTRIVRADATSKSHSSKATPSRSSAASKLASRSSPTARCISKTASRSRSPNRSRRFAAAYAWRLAMSFLEFPISRYQFTLVAFAMLVALGVTAFSEHSAPGRPVLPDRDVPDHRSPIPAPSRRTSSAWSSSRSRIG